MYASSLGPRAVRRGIVLILVLGMLGLMALIGVTFAVFAGQSLINGRNFAQGVSRPQAEALMDYALAQLINDTNIPTSAIRGHSLLRDMYGNDSVYRGSNPPANAAAETGGLLTNAYVPGVGVQPLHFTAYGPRVNGTNGASTAFYNQYQYQTNIPISGQYYGLDFTRWIVRFPVNGVAQSFEVLEDDASGSVVPFHLFTLASNLINGTNDPTVPAPGVTSGDWTSFIYTNPNLGAQLDLTNNPGTVSKGYSSLGKEINLSTGTLSSTNTSAAFVLDGRYMRAFNGAGLTQTASRTDSLGNAIDVYPFNYAAYGNFRLLNRLNAAYNFATVDPDSIGMDEDYDACDLENWYLAIQSADGQVVVPSFHRPGILMAGDWSSTASLAQQAKILRPRQADHSPLFPPDPSTPDSTTGKLTYDVDNDGDGITDSVWLDLGYPVQREPGGKLFKPLFSFMILGLNGRLPLNTVGNLQARATGDKTNTSGIGQGAGQSSLGPTGNNNADATVQVPYPGPYAPSTNAMFPDALYFQPPFSSQVYVDTPLWDHASHVGYSVNEINPKFALQNAPSNLYAGASGNVPANPFGVIPYPPANYYNGNYATSSYFQYDNAGVSVALTQLRNLLAGTVPTDVQNPLPVSSLIGATGGVNLNYFSAANQPRNYDLNVVIVDGLPYVLPNNVADGYDAASNTGVATPRTRPAVAGRWGEPQGIPLVLPNVSSNAFPPYNAAPILYPTYWYNNPVRAGRSFLLQSGTNDGMDDDGDALDPYLPSPRLVQIGTNPPISEDLASDFSLVPSTVTTATPYEIPIPGYTGTAVFNRGRPGATTPTPYPEFLDRFDGSGQRAIAVERIRSFTTPIDPSGSGRVVDFLNRPNNDHDFGNGSDKFGRTSFFRYFRPAGMPQEIRYPYSNANATFPYPYATNSGLGQQYLMPVLLPAGQSSNPNPASQADTETNRYHGYQAALTMYVADSTSPLPYRADRIVPMAGMPYDWDMNANMGAGGPANGYAFTYDPTTANMPAPTNPKINLMAPTMVPLINSAAPVIKSVINSSWGPNLAGSNPPPAYVISYPASVVNGLMGTAYLTPFSASPYIGGGSLNIDEADEMNLYDQVLADQPFGPSDLEWLYRKHDVDGATLSSRLAKLAPVSFLNPADGQTRRRLFSVDTWELNRFSYANDNPNGQYAYNSRFLPNASPSLENMNQVVTGTNGFNPAFANPVATEFLPNPTLPPTGLHNNIGTLYPNNSQVTSNTPTNLPLALTPNNNQGNLFNNAFATGAESNGVVQSFGNPSTLQVQTPSIAHGDRKINLNFPLPIANDPAEPVRQKWCRETYQLLKAILPPASIDTPEELAALSQFVVNIVDFRDTDCTMTRFVNTDLEVTDAFGLGTTGLDPTSPAVVPATNPPSLDQNWDRTTTGVKFATTTIPGGFFPYDPRLYSPDAQTHYLVQHGMEYSPIAINEVMAYQTEYFDTKSGKQANNRRLFVELINTLSAEQNGGSSDIPLGGWDLVVTPDAFGWGRPDPVTGDVSAVAWPPLLPGTSSSPAPNPNPPLTTGVPPTQPATPLPAGANQRQPVSSTAPLSYVGWAPLPRVSVPAIKGGTPTYFLLANQNSFAGLNATGNGTSSIDAESTPIARGTGTGQVRDVIPDSILPTPSAMSSTPTNETLPTGSGKAMMFWAYLRRPANPFDDAPLSPERPNREMVVVDAFRFAFVEGGGVVAGTAGSPPTTSTAGTNAVFSLQRLQPYRGGHLVPTDTKISTLLGNTAPAAPNDTVFQQRPGSAYGYSEQTVPGAAGTNHPIYYVDKTSGSLPSVVTTTGNVTNLLAKTLGTNYLNSFGSAGASADTNWSPVPFLDRDFSSVAELLLVPGCPPGLFTKQFVEEPYPGNYTATGHDDSSFLSGGSLYSGTAIKVPAAPNVGRKDFPGLAASGPNPSFPSYPYLPDNFYYSAASVAPPQAGSSLDASYLSLTTEIGGWTGAGWHKMLEFFEVPSSANGATGPASNGTNYDWARADLKPGLININLIIDEEVFAGVFDDPRLNEQLAVMTSSIPAVVTQINDNGYPATDLSAAAVANGFGQVYGAQPIFGQNSQLVFPGGLNLWNNPPQAGTSSGLPAGRGYSYRDPNLLSYNAANAPVFPPQQVHGIKAAFCDFLKLRHGGSGFLFGFGNGPTGSGDYPTPILTNQQTTLLYPAVQSYPFLALPLAQPFQPIASERPYRSLSYPDINYTIMRPASPPPSPQIISNGQIVAQGTQPPLPITNETLPAPNPVVVNAGLENLLSYAGITGPPYVQLQPILAPMNQNLLTTPGNNYQYLFDPGLKNPFLPVQYVNKTSPQDNPVGSRHLAPPYPTAGPSVVTPAPFPPPIPPTPARRLIQVPDHGVLSGVNVSNANMSGGYDSTRPVESQYAVNQPTIPRQLSTGVGSALQIPPTLVADTREVFLPDNYTPQTGSVIKNLLGGGGATDYRQHPLYRTEMLQKVMNLTTVRTHQFAVWITVGFFDVVRPGTAELGITDVLGQEIGLAAGRNVRYRSFFVIDRTRSTGFNPYYPGNFRDCVSYRRRIE